MVLPRPRAAGVAFWDESRLRVFLTAGHLFHVIRSLTSISLIPVLLSMSSANTAFAADPTSLEVKIVEGDGATYAPGSRATRGIGVVVLDENGRLVEGATVGFTLPMNGPGGEFAAGSRTEIITTRGDGLASAWGMRWNRTAGPFEIRVTAVKGQARGETTVKQFLSGLPQSSSSAKLPGGGGGSHKVLWILMAGAAAAGAAGFALKGGSSGTPSSTATTAATGVQIGTPTISVGRP
jgi:hypothetical protein